MTSEPKMPRASSSHRRMRRGNTSATIVTGTIAATSVSQYAIPVGSSSASWKMTNGFAKRHATHHAMSPDDENHLVRLKPDATSELKPDATAGAALLASVVSGFNRVSGEVLFVSVVSGFSRTWGEVLFVLVVSGFSRTRTIPAIAMRSGSGARS